MAWIQSEQTLRYHPKTRKLSRLLGCSLAETIGYLHLFWWWALDYAEDGDLSNYEPADIADVCEWTRDPQTFWDALISAGFIDTPGKVHDWQDYVGRLVSKREANRRRARAAYAKRKECLREDYAQTTHDDGEDYAQTTGSLQGYQPTIGIDVTPVVGVTSGEDRLCALARTAITGWRSRTTDTETFAKLLATWSEEQIAETITRLAADQATRSKPFSDPRAALGKWLKRVKPQEPSQKPPPVDPSQLEPWQAFALSWFDVGRFDAFLLPDFDERDEVMEWCTSGLLSRGDVLAGRKPA